MTTTQEQQLTESSTLPEDSRAIIGEGNKLKVQAEEVVKGCLATAEEGIQAGDLPEDSLEYRELQKLLSQVAEAAQAFETRVERTSSSYRMSPELKRTIEKGVKILHKPLLVEGEPGTGKTSLAYALAGEEGLPIIHCRGKSTITADSVMYEVDHVARLSDASLSSAIPEAMRTEADKWTKHIEQGGSAEDPGFQAFMNRFEKAAKLLNLDKVADVRNYITYGELGEAIARAAKGEKVILLFDEIDKAKRDFPNDLLDELEHLTMRIRETGEEISAPRENVIVIITSNHEKDLPEPFLRRCLYSYLEFPTPDHMTEIVRAHLPDIDENLLRSAVSHFYGIREAEGLQKQPSTSEMLDWIKILIAMNVQDITGQIPFPEALVKTKKDLDLVKDLFGYPYPSEEDLEEHSYIDNYNMETAAYYAMKGHPVFRLRLWLGSGLNNDLFLNLAENGYRFTTPNETDKANVDKFSIDEPGFTYIGNGLFVLRVPNDLEPKDEQAWETRTTELCQMLSDQGLMVSQYVTSKIAPQFGTILASNELFIKATDKNNQVFYKLPNGDCIYEEPVKPKKVG